MVNSSSGGNAYTGENASGTSVTASGTNGASLPLSFQDIYPSSSAADRVSILGPGIGTINTWEGSGLAQEPMGWFNNGVYNILYTGGTSQCIGYAYATTPTGPWTKPLTTPVIGNGTGGVAGGSFVAHTGLYIEGATIYVVTSIVPATGTANLYSAPLNFDPMVGPVFSLVGAIMSLPASYNKWGNFAIVPIVVGQSYALLWEAALTASSVYQTGLATATGSLTGGITFTATQSPLSQLISGITYWGSVAGKLASGVAETGGPFVSIEGSTCVLYYHAGPAGTTPTDIFRAVSPVSDLVNWTVQNGGYPVARRLSYAEVDQIADPHVVQGPNGDFWMFTDAYDNLNSAAFVEAIPMFRSTTALSNGSKVSLQKSGDSFNELSFRAPVYLNAGVTAYTALNRDDIRINSGTSNIAITAPRANWGAFFRVGNFNAATHTATVNINAADAVGPTTVLGGIVQIQQGEMLTFYSLTQKQWVLSRPLVETVRVITAAGAVTVTLNDKHVSLNKTSGAATVVNLPASPPPGFSFTVDDQKGDAATNNITVTPAAGNIDGSATFVINTNYGSWSGYYNGTFWKTVTSR